MTDPKIGDGDGQTATQVAPEEIVEDQESTTGEGWRVVLHNDEVHTMEEVVAQLMLAIQCTVESAIEITLRAHSRGQSTVTITDRAEADRIAGVLRRIALKVTVESCG